MYLRDEFKNCETNVRLHGKVALVTGATSGLGLETARDLATRGAKVIIASRNPGKLETAKRDIIQTSGNENVIARQMDFESLASVRRFAHETIATEPRLDILINNVGAIGLEDKLTENNLQLMMQVNYFGAFLLTFLLFPLMKSSAPSRIVNISSLALLFGDINFDHMNDVGRYSNVGLYCNAKLATVLFTAEMNRRVNGSGVNVYSMDPGLIKSEILRNIDDDIWKSLLNNFVRIFGRSTDRVAKMPVYLAVDPNLKNFSGSHFRDCMEFYSHWSVNDTVLTKQLWDISKKLVNIVDEEDWEY
ncbi:unnamed protein product [Diatraea saccharalis]|uniref:Uncharacterized protein n=1 Tax=Diatraea saccharalis TaxID=40085 RepID=A0A9N9WFS7_9NEOP|nr:unnamed protein product [Diatraea saccharalis]